MKVAALCLSVSALTAILASSGCNYAKPVMYLQIVNRSGETMRNLEVIHPTGTFGMYELHNDQTHRHMVTLGKPCKFHIDFEDLKGKTYAKDFNLGSKCPTEIAFDVGPGLSITERQVRP